MYRKLAVAISINVIVMFLLTYVMIDDISHLQVNINSVYMALMMAAPMVVVMLVVMRSMFENRKLNHALHASAVGVFLLLLLLVRTQTPVGNEQFLRSMIPHHSGAIVMCERATITDPEISALCDEIVRAQEEEIDRMNEILARL
jgi:uncharacterized protein (DUF305 family)